MNQSVIFTDTTNWAAGLASVHFTAQQQGMNINCYISLTSLSELSGQVIEKPASALVVFEQYRFDIEDKAEALIEIEAFDEQGRIFIR